MAGNILARGRSMQAAARLFAASIVSTIESASLKFVFHIDRAMSARKMFFVELSGKLGLSECSQGLLWVRDA